MDEEVKKVDNPKINIRAWKPVEKRKTERVDYRKELEKKEKKTMYKEAQEPKHSEPLLERLDAVDKDDIVFVRDLKEKEVKDLLVEEKEDNHSPFSLIESDSNHLQDKDDIPKYDIEIIDKKTEDGFKNRFPSFIRKEDTFTNYNHRHVESEIVTPPRKKNKRISFQFNSQLLKTVAAGVGAIITGMVLGTLLLYYVVNPFFGDQENTSMNSPIAVAEQNNSGTASLAISEQVIYVLQAGVFSDRVGAETALAEQKKNGMNGSIIGNGPFHLFVGMTMAKENGVAIANALKEKGIEIYVKEYPINSFKGNLSEETYTSFSKWIQTGEQLVTTLASQTGESISTDKSTIDFTVIQKQHQQFLLDTQALAPLLQQEQLTEQEKVVNEMVKQMNIAIQALAAYQKNPNLVYLWDIEAGLLNYKMQYQKLMEL